jgi:protein-tyrosine phosphatase
MAFVDLHSHLLWATDDGPVDAAESVQLCAALVEAGFSDAAATSHSWPELPGAAANAARRGELQALLQAGGVPLTLHAGAENRLDGELLERVARGDARPLGGGPWVLPRVLPWVLVEAPHALPLPGIEALCFRLQIAGLRVLVAHPERCRAFQDDASLAGRLVDQGCAMQIEIGSLAGVYGRPALKLARSLLEKGLVAVAASDVHRPTSALRLLREGLPALREVAGDGGLAVLLDRNPRRMLRGDAL